MSNYVLIVDGVVVQSDRTGKQAAGFVEATEEVVPGFLYGGGKFSLPEPPPAPIPERVTARQFKMQLEKDGLLDSVEAWVGQQTKLVRIAYDNSGTFVRTEPMMQAGFAALDFKVVQIDAFFMAAAVL